MPENEWILCVLVHRLSVELEDAVNTAGELERPVLAALQDKLDDLVLEVPRSCWFGLRVIGLFSGGRTD